MTSISDFGITPPSFLICPLTKNIFNDPVVADDGFTYEKEAISSWLKNNSSSPLTREYIRKKLTSNKVIKTQCMEFFDKVKNNCDTIIQNNYPNDYKKSIDVYANAYEYTGSTIFLEFIYKTSDNVTDIDSRINNYLKKYAEHLCETSTKEFTNISELSCGNILKLKYKDQDQNSIDTASKIFNRLNMDGDIVHICPCMHGFPKCFLKNKWRNLNEGEECPGCSRKVEFQQTFLGGLNIKLDRNTLINNIELPENNESELYNKYTNAWRYISYVYTGPYFPLYNNIKSSSLYWRITAEQIKYSHIYCYVFNGKKDNFEQFLGEWSLVMGDKTTQIYLLKDSSVHTLPKFLIPYFSHVLFSNRSKMRDSDFLYGIPFLKDFVSVDDYVQKSKRWFSPSCVKKMLDMSSNENPLKRKIDCIENKNTDNVEDCTTNYI